MNEKVKILLVGIGGFGNVYVTELLEAENKDNFEIVGVVDIKPELCEHFVKLKEMGVKIYSTMEDFYLNNNADLAVISTPLHLHSQQTCFALSKGSNVLCEKPMCATIDEALGMIKARDEAKKFVAIGYQASFSELTQSLKKDIMDGVFGKPKRLKTILLWPRELAYFKRSWAGKLKDEKGNWILDSVAANATSHFLHNMFYITGDKVDTSSRPRYVTAELYRGNGIENFDTSVIRAITETGIAINFYSSHCCEKYLDVTYCFEFENAIIKFGDLSEKSEMPIVAYFNDGRKKEYINTESGENKKIWTCIEAITKETEIPCGLEAAMSHTLCINGAQESMPEIIEFPENLIKLNEEEQRVYVEGLGEVMKKCYENWATPSEMGVSWAKPGKRMDMEGYSHFELGGKDDYGRKG